MLSSTKTKLFFLSAYILYLELVVIRWIGTEVRIFAYLQNTVLVVCFLGIGAGCFASKRSAKLTDSLTALFTLCVLFAFPFTRKLLGNISELLSSLRDFVIFAPWLSDNPLEVLANVSVGLSLTFILLILVFEIFFPLGQLLGQCFEDFKDTIQAYSINVGASLLGIWFCVAVSALSMPPFVWIAISVLLAGPIVQSCSANRRRDLLFLVGMVVASYFAGFEPGAISVNWSPYQKLVLKSSSKERGEYGSYTLNVNNTTYQEMINLSDSNIASHKDIFSPELKGLGQYDVPYRMHPNPAKVLIVGAGSGNDVAAALRHGVEEIVAVDIDPVIVNIGKTYHPEAPYSSPKVKVYVDDARSFFATTNEKYDMVVFGLLDSHSVTSLTNARLDHYVYTRESIARAKSLLKDGGVLVLSFYAIHSFISDRFERVLNEVFGEPPLWFPVPASGYGRGAVVFVAGDHGVILKQLENQPDLSAKIQSWKGRYLGKLTGTTPIATDDWPYIYLESARIPSLYWILAGLIGVLLVYCNRKARLLNEIADWDRTSWHFFFLGAAFLLLEVQNISKASVVLGSTWVVNAVIISGVLIMILLANLIAATNKISSRLSYLMLFLICAGLYLLDLSSFAFLPYMQKAIVVGCLTTLPMLFSGIIFIRSFCEVDRKDLALGANLLGSLVGALFQSLTFIMGIKALLLIVAGFYVMAMLAQPWGLICRRD